LTDIAQITQLARSILSDSNKTLGVEQAISEAVDMVYEQVITAGNWNEHQIRKQVQSTLTGYGSLEELLLDPEVEEIWINSPTKVFISKNSQTSALELGLDALAVRQTVEKMLRDSGRRLDRSVRLGL
jgi:pilus assembly protein CpaF